MTINNLYLKCMTAVFLGGMVSAAAVAQERSNAKTVLKQCYYKYAGDDQRSNMTITVKDIGGKPQESQYRRLWKNYQSKGDDLVDKVVLFTIFPPHKKGLSFMRWGYSAKSGKPPEMWVYLTDMRKIRRLSQRDPANKAWVIKDDDLRLREMVEDKHRYKGVRQLNGKTYHLVEFLPKSDPVYSKRVAWFEKGDGWDDCVLRQVDFYGKQDSEMVKQQYIEWVKIGDAWAWKKVSIESRYGDAYIRYDMRDIEVNVGLKDDVFTRYTMKRGYRE